MWSGVMRAIEGDIGAAAAKKWNGDENLAIKQRDCLEKSSSPSKRGSFRHGGANDKKMLGVQG